MQEYKELGHMEKTNDDNKLAVYLPHHAVIREDKETTKVRVVYNASAKGSNGYSLNDNLLVGPVIQPNLRTLLIKWRTHKICIVGDITKMYRQIQVTSKHTDLQRIVWRNDAKGDIEIYKLLTVTFGTASAPYLAVKTLSQLAFDEQHKYPRAAAIVKNSFYMDDLMTGSETIEEAKAICSEVSELLILGGFEMQKWSSNSNELLKDMLTKRKSNTNKFEIKMDKVIKILGLFWDRNDDLFKFTLNLPTDTQPCTKRSILSYLTRLFDPFGWLAPVLITAKILIQKLWLLGSDWDQELPVELTHEWLEFKREIIYLKTINLRRWLNTSSCNEKIEIHGFADASMVAYAAVAYIKAIDKDGKVHINIIAAKSRVAPLKQISIPRLELCAATLLAKLLENLMIILSIPKHDVYAWTDSTIVLAWLQSHPSKWQTFVANRVSEITQILDNTNWRHVQSSDNPADLPSRGIRAPDLAGSELWWKGPKWLQNNVMEPKTLIIPETEIEKRKENYKSKAKQIEVNFKSLHVKVSQKEHAKEKPFWEKYSSLIKIKRVIAYCRRFITRRQLEEHDDPESLKVKELEKALEIVIKYYQNNCFLAEIKQLKEKSKVNRTSVLSTLSPFLDENGLLRVGGRLQNAHIPYKEKHPCIIPSNVYLTSLLIQDAHRKTLHGGNQLTLAILRQQFFILNVRREVKKFIRQCVICVRHRASTNQQIMGQLPTCRVNPGRAFETIGVDYAGPVKIRLSKGRGFKATKGYIGLFVCMSTRAVHIEAVTDMTTEVFLAAFRRFVSRRGHCNHLWSDNGSTFVGAAKELGQLLKKGQLNITQEVSNILSNDGTTWHFIPPKSPNFGGIWEAAIKSTKYHLTRVIGDSTLTYEEMATLLTQIEACLNSRPICRDTTTDDSLVSLTPGHFLIGEPIIGVPENEFKNSNISLITRWQAVQRMTQHFWKRWSSEYLHTLQCRYKWKEGVPNLKLGDIVVVKDEGLPPTKWLLGRIIQLHPGKDNKVRVVTLRSKKDSILTRPVSKLVLLPTDPPMLD